MLKKLVLLSVLSLFIGTPPVWAQEGPGYEDYQQVKTNSQKQATKMLIPAIKAGFYDIVKQLIARGADINALDKNGTSPLNIAVHYSRPGIVQLLIDNGARVNSIHKALNNTNLMSAAFEGKLHILEILLPKVNNINFQNKDGLTALMYASGGHCNSPNYSWRREDFRKILHLLIKRGVNLNLRNKEGRTAMMEAAFWGHSDLVKILLEAGTDKTIKDKQGLTALDLANVQILNKNREPIIILTELQQIVQLLQ